MGALQEKLSPGLGQIHGGGPLVGMLHQGLGTGGKNLDKEDELLELMKKLVVKKRIVLVTKVASLDMLQVDGEAAKDRRQCVTSP